MMKGRRNSRVARFLKDVVTHTPIIKMVMLLVGFWVLFSAGLYLTERDADDTTITSFGAALYWGVAAFSTAGIAETPKAGLSQLIGGVWIVLGSMLFFGTIVATVTTYFMRPLQRPAKRIIDTIEYNLEQLEDLSIEELDLLKETTDALILHMEDVKAKHQKSEDAKIKAK